MDDFNYLENCHLNYYNDINHIILTINICGDDDDDNNKCRDFINKYTEKNEKIKEINKDNEFNKYFNSLTIYEKNLINDLSKIYLYINHKDGIYYKKDDQDDVNEYKDNKTDMKLFNQWEII